MHKIILVLLGDGANFIYTTFGPEEKFDYTGDRLPRLHLLAAIRNQGAPDYWGIPKRGY